jgi:2-dehydro-3-deoxyphosphogalactonate aldolase
MNVAELLVSGAPPIIAILRGLRSDEAVDVAAALVDAGIRMIEVPLNSPAPFDSIAKLVERFGATALIGAGTVTDVAVVERLAGVGGRLLVAPNVDTAVIAAAVAHGLEVMPGFATPSEAFAAIGAGARRLKLFPAGALGAAYLRAVREVLPAGVEVWAVGGTGSSNIREWLTAGAAGVGVGSALFRPADSASLVGARARELVQAWRVAAGILFDQIGPTG